MSRAKQAAAHRVFVNGVIGEDAGLFYTSMQKLVGGVGEGPSYLIAVDIMTGEQTLKQTIGGPLMYISLITA